MPWEMTGFLKKRGKMKILKGRKSNAQFHSDGKAGLQS